MGRATLHLHPGAAGAVGVVLFHSLTGVDAVVGNSAAIEITAPCNVNYGRPERTWDEDVRNVLQAVSRGQVLLGEDDAGRLVMVDIPAGAWGSASATATGCAPATRRPGHDTKHATVPLTDPLRDAGRRTTSQLTGRRRSDRLAARGERRVQRRADESPYPGTASAVALLDHHERCVGRHDPPARVCLMSPSPGVAHLSRERLATEGALQRPEEPGDPGGAGDQHP